MAEYNPEIIEIADEEGNINLFEILDKIERQCRDQQKKGE